MAKLIRTLSLGRLGKVVRPGLCIMVATTMAVGGVGCTRPFFRKRADMEVDDILTEKDQFADWQIEQYHVYPDPRARFADETNPDRPPMPPDDPASEELAPNPKKPRHAGVGLIEGTGYLELLAAWDGENRAEAAAASKKAEGVSGESQIRAAAAGDSDLTEPVSGESQIRTVAGQDADQKPEDQAKEKPEVQKGFGSPQTSAPITTSLSSPPGSPRPYLLKLERAVELGLINSREYQDARENLYMAALPVATQRFSFAAQFFAFGQAFRQWAGIQTPPPRNNWTLSSNIG